MTTSGFVLLHRTLLESPLWTQLPEAWLKVWIAILLRANFQGSKWWDGQKHVEIPAGSFVASLQTLAKFTNVSVKQIRGALNYLEAAGSVTRQTASHYSIITVTNWETYQCLDSGEGKASGTAKGRARARQKANQGHDEGTIGATEEQKQQEQQYSSGAKSAPGDLFGDAAVGFDVHLQRVAAAMHARHPRDRRGGIPAVVKALKTICTKSPAGDRAARLDGINRRHAGWCLSPKWTEEGGKFANGLENWLAPTMGRFDTEPPVSSPGPASGSNYTRVA